MRLSKQWIWIFLPLLVACSREPSEQELKQVYEQSLEKTNALTTKFGGQSMRIELKSFKKLSCDKKSETKQYLCQIEVNVDLPILGQQTQQGEITVQKADQDWMIIQD